MNIEILQSMIDIVFKGNLLYLAPILFLVTVIMFADRLIDLIYYAMGKGEGRRGNY